MKVRNMNKKMKMKNDQKQFKSPGCQPDVAVLNAFYGPNGPRSYKSNVSDITKHRYQ